MRTIQFSPNLHSSMERLKVTNGTIPCLVNCNLHSSMERLKVHEKHKIKQPVQ